MRWLYFVYGVVVFFFLLNLYSVVLLMKDDFWFCCLWIFVKYLMCIVIELMMVIDIFRFY